MRVFSLVTVSELALCRDNYRGSHSISGFDDALVDAALSSCRWCRGVCVVEPALSRARVPGWRVRRSAERTGGNRRMAGLERALGTAGRSDKDYPCVMERRACLAPWQALQGRRQAL